MVAMGASVRLIIPQLPYSSQRFLLQDLLYIQKLVPYRKYVKILKYLTLSLFTYVITAIIVGGNWSQILISSISSTY